MSFEFWLLIDKRATAAYFSIEDYAWWGVNQTIPVTANGGGYSLHCSPFITANECEGSKYAYDMKS